MGSRRDSVDLSKIQQHYQQVGEGSELPEIGEWLDSSKVACLDLCPRKFYYRHERHLIPYEPEEVINWANPMTFGHALHAALASWYDGSGLRPETCPCPTFEGCRFCGGKPIPRMIAQFLLNYPDDPDDPRDPRTRQRGIDILIEYVNKWKRESCKIVAVEVPFAIPFFDSNGNLLFNYIGRIDLLVEEDERLKPWDHKTTTRYGMMFEQQFKVSHQVTGYLKGVNTVLNHHGQMPTVTEADINCIRVTTNITDESFMRMTTSRTPEEFDDWEKETRRKFQELLTFRMTGHWPKRAPFACAAYNRQCEYYGLCSSPDSRLEENIATRYMVRKWTPIGDHE